MIQGGVDVGEIDRDDPPGRVQTTKSLHQEAYTGNAGGPAGRGGLTAVSAES
jgi:hypothetical protein